MTRRATTWFVGPLPPPVHGFANVCFAMLQRLRERSEVRVLDRSPALPPLRRAGSYLATAASLLLAPGGGLVYVGVSGGRGQWIDLPLLVLANLRGRPVCLHHHSYAYLDRRSRRSALLFGAAPDATHVVLAESMKRRLSDAYDIRPERIAVVSNAAFMADGEAPPAPRIPAPSAPGPIRIGFLSNITAEKGIFEFLALLRALQSRGIPWVAEAAGPVDPAIRQAFDDAKTDLPALREIGPVYGPRKDAFLSGIDVLAFPSRYVNEAEPLVIHEALSHGIHVVATRRGAIADVLDAGGGVAFDEREFVDLAASEIERIAKAPDLLASLRREAHARAGALRDRARHGLRALLDAMIPPPADDGRRG